MLEAAEKWKKDSDTPWIANIDTKNDGF